MRALEMGAVETLIIYENLEHPRLTLKNTQTGDEVVKILSPEEALDKAQYVDPESGAELEVTESEPYVEWLAENYRSFGTQLEFVTNRSQEGSQFVRGFGGIGGLLRYVQRVETS
mmetsp:Transcript_17580/g.71120  ORF Transcript_17580/g.71120 Transcript_17580/m.71120 type:complete len:115 (-) Transcript_17580:489-833(-)